MDTTKSIIQKEIDKFVKSCDKNDSKEKISRRADTFVNYIAQQAVSFAFKNYMDLYKARHGNVPEDKKKLVRKNVNIAIKKDALKIKDWSKDLTSFMMRDGYNKENGKKIFYISASKVFLYFYMRGTHQANILFIGKPPNNLFDKPENKERG